MRCGFEGRPDAPDAAPSATERAGQAAQVDVAAPWALPWYAAVAWVILALVPRNPMTRWLTLVTVYLALMHCSGGGPATWANN